MRVHLFALGLICACTSPDEGLTPGELPDAGSPIFPDAAVASPDAALPAEPAIFTGHPFRGSYRTGDPALALVLDEELAYVAAAERGVLIIDVSNPRAPSLRGSLAIEGSIATGIAKAGDLLFVVDGTALRIIDVSDPAAPALRSSTPIEGYAAYVAARDSRVFVAAIGGGFSIIDVSDPDRPNLLSSLAAVSGPVAVRGDVAHVAGSVIDISDPAAPVIRGGTSFDGYDIAVDGETAYLATQNGLAILDAADPATPVIRGEFLVRGPGESMALSGGLVYLGGYEISALDVTDPALPVLVARYDLPGFGARDMVVRNGLAYLAAGPEGLQIVDLSSPGTAAPEGKFAATGTPREVALSGDLALVAGGEGGLFVFDVRTREATLLASIDTPGFAENVVVSGSRAYVADGFFGVAVIDLADPSRPVLENSLETPGYAYSLEREGELIFLADATTFRIIDISVPGAPVLRGRVLARGAALDVASSNGRAFFADSQGVRIFDVSDPDAPQLLGSFDSEDQQQTALASGDTLFLAGLATGLKVIDVSSPAAPILRGSIPTLVYVEDLSLSGNALFAAGARTHVDIIDISDLDAPVLLANVPATGTPHGIAVAAGFAVVVTDLAMMVLDVSNPANPIAWGGAPMLDNSVVDLAVRGTLAYLACGFTGLRILDIADPTAIRRRGSVRPAFGANALSVQGAFVYLAGGSAGVEIVEAFDPDAPSSIAVFDTPGTAMNVFLDGDRAYIADWGSGVQAINIESETAPIFLAGFSPEPDGRVQDLIADGDTAYVASPGSFQIIGVADPRAPVLAGVFHTPGAELRDRAGFVAELAVEGDTVFVAGGFPGFHAVDISNTRAPELLATIDVAGNANGLDLDAGMAYVAAGGGGLQLIDVADPAHPRPRAYFDLLGANDVAYDGGRAYVIGDQQLRVVDVSPRLSILGGESSAPRGSTVRFALEWIDDYPAHAEQFACATVSGACRVIEIDQQAHTATLEWMLPTTPGLHEIAVAVGNYRDAWIERRQITVR